MVPSARCACHHPLVRAYVGVTDGDWYRHLRAAGVDEVNFWRPSGRNTFRALEVGEPFFFKSHYRDGNRVVGGGFYSDFAALRLSDAWRLLGPANGASSEVQMRARVGRYRVAPLSADEDPVIGCVFVRDVVFFAEDEHLAPPPGWAANVVQGRSYDLADPECQGYFDLLLTRMLGMRVELDLSEPWHRAGPVYGDPRLLPQRVGQRSFQAVVLDRYRGRCAVTGDRIRPVLEAAHIRPLSSGGEHRIDNGLLLRSDVHTLFDAGYLGVDTRYRLRVSPRLRGEFENGEEFYERARSTSPILLPQRRVDRPNREYLEWHLDEVFKAS
jgi:putative restriction endonuclease